MKSARDVVEEVIRFPEAMVASAERLRVLDPLLVATVILPMVRQVGPGKPFIYTDRIEYNDGRRRMATMTVGAWDVILSETGVRVNRGGMLVNQFEYPIDVYACRYLGSGLFYCISTRPREAIMIRVRDGRIFRENSVPYNHWVNRLADKRGECLEIGGFLMHPNFPMLRHIGSCSPMHFYKPVPFM